MLESNMAYNGWHCAVVVVTGRNAANIGVKWRIQREVSVAALSTAACIAWPYKSLKI